jgi:two-component system cell cycle sensor histidine kinase/response regulator CckA
MAEPGDSADELERLRRRAERERQARLEAEAIAERVTRDLYGKAEIMGLLQRVAAAANEAATADDALRVAVAQVCKSTGWPIGHVYRPAEDASGALVPTDIWYLDDPTRFETFRAVTAGTLLPRGIGLPGRVVADGRPACIRDVAADANFPRARAAAAIGIHAGIAVPVLVGAEVVAVLEFFATQVTEPNPELLEAMLHIGGQLGRVVERERTARALRESERVYRLLAENVTDVIFVYDLAFRPTYISPSAVRLRGYTIEEMMGQSLADRLTPESLELAMKTYAAVRGDTGPPYLSRTLDLEVKCKDGSTKWTETQMSFIRDDAGRPIGILGIARDITERRAATDAHTRLEEQLRQSQKMEAIGRLAGGVAHDFNNLLTVITGRTSMLLESKALEANARKDLDMIRDAAERAAALTHQLLAFSRKQILQPRVLDVNGVLARLAPMLRRVIGEDIEFGIVSRAPECGVLADPGQLEQVVMNLVVNARDAMPRGGRLTIETATVELDEAHARQHVGVQPGPHVVLAVSDTGVGMDAATRERIFEPFFTTKREGEGTGLGLATVFGIVAQSGGTIWVYSEPGRGTTFKIYLPRVEAPAPPAASGTAEPPPRGTETILLVEDDDGVRFVGVDVLQRLGYVVLAARNGEEALRTSVGHAGPIALLVSDIVMPGMSGPDLRARLAEQRPDMKVMFLSGYASDAIVRHGILDPDVAFIEKPFSPGALARKVRAVLDADR